MLEVRFEEVGYGSLVWEGRVLREHPGTNLEGRLCTLAFSLRVLILIAGVEPEGDVTFSGVNTRD